MRLDGKLAKLEQKAKVTLRCDWCRYVLSDVTPSGKKARDVRPDDFMQAVCCWCGCSFSVSLTGLSERQREAVRIYYRKDNGESYMDARVYAAEAWHNASRIVESWRRGDLEKKVGRLKQTRHNPPQKKDRRAQARDELKKKAQKFLRKMAAQEEKLYGPHQHDLPARIEALEALKGDRFGFIPGTYQKMGVKEQLARTVIHALSVMQLCEPVIWGETLPETDESLLEVQAIVKEIEDEREREKLAKEEADRLREEERKRQHEEYLTRTRSQQPANVNPVASQSTNPDYDHVLRHAMGETAYNAMREAQSFASGSRPIDAQGRRSIEIPYIEPDQESQPPPDDGTLHYQQKLAHWRKTGVWPPDPWQKPGY